MDAVHQLMQFSLTHQEARLYALLCTGGRATGYELAKASGISRSNVYAGLANLVEKGAVRQEDGKPARYAAVPPRDFFRNVIRTLERSAAELETQLSPPPGEEEPYYSVTGSKNIADQIETMLEGTQQRVYASMGAEVLARFLPALAALAEAGKKVVVITDRPVELPGATVYLARAPVGHIRLISDTAVALTGDWDRTPQCSCLYSRRKNLVDLLRDSMRNELLLTQENGKEAML